MVYNFREQRNNKKRMLGEVERINKLESLTDEENQKLDQIINLIKGESAQDAAQKNKEWFDAALRPLLVELAKVNYAELEIDDHDSVITATIKNQCIIDVTRDSLLFSLFPCMHFLEFRVEDGEPVLELTFDCNRYQ